MALHLVIYRMPRFPGGVYATFTFDALKATNAYEEAKLLAPACKVHEVLRIPRAGENAYAYYKVLYKYGITSGPLSHRQKEVEAQAVVNGFMSMATELSGYTHRPSKHWRPLALYVIVCLATIAFLYYRNK